MAQTGTSFLEPTDSDLINRTVDGDTEAFGELFKRYRSFIFAVGVKCCGKVHEAEDLLQDTFIKALGALPGFRGDSSFKGWLATIARNQCLDIRKKRRLPTVSLDEPLENPGENPISLEIPDSTNDPERVLLAKEAARVVNRAIGSLPQHFRETLVMHDLEGIPFEDICARAGLKPATAKSRLHRARVRVRDRVETYFRTRS